MPEDTVELTSDFSDETLLEICRAADVIACECPGYLTRLLRQVRAFRHYTVSCIEQFPEDVETHRWLDQQGAQIEQLLFQTILTLMQKENLIDESNRVSLSKLSDRAREIALKQIGESYT